MTFDSSMSERRESGIGLSLKAARKILGLPHDVPMTASEMSRGLRVAVYPNVNATERVNGFAAKLIVALRELGAAPCDFHGLVERDGRLPEGVVVLAPGEGTPGDLAIDCVRDLYANPVVGIFDGLCPAEEHEPAQTRLDRIVGILAWHMVHVAIFVDECGWVVCTMNGAMVRCRGAESFVEEVRSVLIPKLCAQVIPPKRGRIVIRRGALDVSSNPRYREWVEDFTAAASMWRGNETVISHTPLDHVRTRGRRYQRLVAAYLDSRTGMSYGFQARQLPLPVAPAMCQESLDPSPGSDGRSETRLSRIKGNIHVPVTVGRNGYLVPVPEVWVLATRSGCDKSRLDPARDIVRMGLVNGVVFFDTPKGLDRAADCNPSYDTLTILAHAAGNAMAASLLRAIYQKSVFADQIENDGLALLHWHGYPSPASVPPGYFIHGSGNLPVSCSTPQSALFALAGKMKVLQNCLNAGGEYLGDVHIEPHHGTNVTGGSLASLAGVFMSKQAASVTGVIKT